MDPNNPQHQRSRTNVAFYIAILGGLLVGFFIKRVRIGVIIGLVLAGLIVLTGWWKKKQNR